MDGWEVARQAREIEPTFPILGITRILCSCTFSHCLDPEANTPNTSGDFQFGPLTDIRTHFASAGLTHYDACQPVANETDRY